MTPAITIEVLSKSNTRAGMLPKPLHYLDVGVGLVVTVDPQRQQGQRWSLVDGARSPAVDLEQFRLVARLRCGRHPLVKRTHGCSHG
jgi:Uma2 family endonuclease